MSLFQVGFNAGDGEHYYSVPGSMTDAVLNLPQMSNIGIPGQYVFRVDQNKISNAGLILLNIIITITNDNNTQ